MTRPDWAEAIRLFIADTMFEDEYGFPEDGSEDELQERIAAAVNGILCDAYGHDIVDDQCMIPAHRYCVYCGRREGAIKGG